MFGYLHVTLITYIPLLTYITFHHRGHEKKGKVQLTPRNEILSLYCTVLSFICKNEEHELENNV